MWEVDVRGRCERGVEVWGTACWLKYADQQQCISNMKKVYLHPGAPWSEQANGHERIAVINKNEGMAELKQKKNLPGSALATLTWCHSPLYGADQNSRWKSLSPWKTNNCITSRKLWSLMQDLLVVLINVHQFHNEYLRFTRWCTILQIY
jgi:hypothetical protein